jgi:lipopolysaccharide transport system permease protein
MYQFQSQMNVKNFLSYWEHRDIIITLIRREWRIKYAGTALRWIWLFLRPLLQLGTYIFVFTYILKIGKDSPSYPLHILSGLIVWQSFLEIVNSAGRAVFSDQELLKKTPIPRLFLPLYRSFLGLPDWGVNLFLYSVLAFSLRASPSFFLVYLPIAILFNWFFAFGVACWCNVWAIFNRDIHHLFMMMVGYILWLTPVFYSLEQVPSRFQFLFNLNPLSGIIALYRFSLYAAPLPNGTWLSLLIGFVVAIVGLVLYEKRQDDFVDSI